MADKSFGVKELNLLNASGTPTVTSPNNLNLNANTVAISTSCTIGSDLDVDGSTNLDNVDIVGITTIRNASGNKLYEGNANASKLFHNGSEKLQTETYGIDINGTLGADQINCSGVSTITVPANANPHSSWDVVNNSSSSYRFTGPGQDGAEDNPDIYLVRGQRYVFKMNASGHPFQIRVSNGGSAYSDGVTNNGAQTGNVVFNVQHDAPAHLFYQCTSHGSMVGNIYIVGQHLANGGNDRILTATSAYGMNAESNLQFDGTNLFMPNELRHLGDPDTKMGFDTDTIKFETAGSERLTIQSNGNKIVQNGRLNINSTFIDFSGSISTPSTAAAIFRPADNTLSFSTANNERLRIGPQGQIGIVGANYGTSGQVLMSQGSGSAVQWASPAYIIHDVWALSSNMTTSSTETKVTTWTRANGYSATIGSAMTESSGIFTFPETGKYKVVFDAYYQSSNSSRYMANRIYKVISATSTRIAQKLTSINQASSVWYQSDKVEAYFDVTNVSTHKIEFTVSTENASTLGSGHSSSLIQTAAYFTKIGDT